MFWVPGGGGEVPGGGVEVGRGGGEVPPVHNFYIGSTSTITCTALKLGCL